VKSTNQVEVREAQPVSSQGFVEGKEGGEENLTLIKKGNGGPSALSAGVRLLVEGA